MMLAKIIVDKLEIQAMSHKDSLLQNKNSTFWMAGSDMLQDQYYLFSFLITGR